MGTLINFISQHISLTPSSKDDYHVRSLHSQKHHFYQQQQQQQQQRSSYFVYSEAFAVEEQRERALQQFPCEEKHSFNPHYQHNLSTSPPFSTSPLSSSPSDSSPSSSAYSSSSSSSSLSRATGVRSSSQDFHQHQQQNSYTHTMGRSTTNYKNDHSFHRHNNRRQSIRCYTYQQQQQEQQESFVDEWMFGIAEDDGIYRGSTARMNETMGPSMMRASPQESPISPSSSSSTASFKSLLSRKSRPQRGSVMNAFTAAATPRSTVSFSPVVSEQTLITSPSSKGLLPSISESSLFSASDSSNGHIAVTSFSSATVSSSCSPQPQQQHFSSGGLTAQQSLMRIAHCSKSDDGWCTQKAGQYTQRYAQSNPRSMMVDGRRGRRM
ncbi:hypothetical protein EDD11_006523 [Mortierella claussenii]|nr:hypothetical protein EDD11_006523 [Mortierella claussenii]